MEQTGKAFSGIPDDPRIERVLFTEEAIRRRVAELAAEIARDYNARDDREGSRLHIVGILNGAFVFTADLARELRRIGGPPATYEFLKAELYGDSLRNGVDSPKVRITLAPGDVRGKDILLVEDMLDQGYTLSKVLDMFRGELGARSVKLCVLLQKQIDRPSPLVRQLREAIRPDYVGFVVPDRWVAGYGLDAGGCFRDLPAIVIVREEYFV